MGTEVFVSDKEEVAEWTISEFDVIITWSTIQQELQKLNFEGLEGIFP